ncbi:tetratricopeptide repeat protein [Thermosulfurimonas sp. F29]|uniref:tetratricopeptide repeat protein n=1 Tax=Thermosulfurimonas sp. F29 TaxID=2867247 RepID=UPI001C82A33A|nr:tetratricopeptide repeat protein [Thermosulfurimonas sp. F29]MBX6423062.1 tetratricopeptide repeat protein [Thermosulfurimonas sp. F29]
MKSVGRFALIVALIFLVGVCAVGAQDEPEKDPAWWLSQARFAYGEGDLLGALYIVKEARRRFPGRGHERLAVLEARILYDLGKVKECVDILGPLSLSYELAPEDLLLLARAYLDVQNPGNALFYAHLAEKKARKPGVICEARVIAARAYLLNRIHQKALLMARKILKDSCSDETVALALEILLEAGVPVREVQKYLAQNPNLKLYAPKIFKYLGDKFLSQGRLPKAERFYFRYLNLSGREEEAPPILLKLAEAAFHRGEVRRARLYYKLLATVWPHRDEAQFAKFRLYHLTYILRKRLGLPTLEQRKALIPIINELRRKHPENPITEEAQSFEIELYLEDRKPRKAFETALDFVQRYPKSGHLARVYRLLCEAENLYLSELFAQKNFSAILSLDRRYQKFARKATCGAHFYWVGKVYEHFYLDIVKDAYFLQAFEWGVPDAYQPELYLSLIEDALRERHLPEARDLLRTFVKKFPFYAQHPRYRYLEASYWYSIGNYRRARGILADLFKQKVGSASLRQRILQTYLSLALTTKDIDLALQIISAPGFKTTDDDFAFLVQLALENQDYLRAKKILKMARKKFPDSTTLKWLAGVYYEKTGRREALEIWRALASENSTEGRLAKGILRSLELVEAARKVIY